MKLFKIALDYFVDVDRNLKDSESIRHQRSALVMLPLIIGPLAVIWGSMYLFIGFYLSASIPLFYSLISFVSLWYYKRSQNLQFLYQTQMLLVLVLPFLLMWSLGGFAMSGFVMIAAFPAPLAGVVYEKERRGLGWFIGFAILVVVSAIFDDYFIELYSHEVMPPFMHKLFLVSNIIVGFLSIYLIFKYFTKKFTEGMYTDFLTSMYNRRYFHEVAQAVIEKNLRKQRKVALLYVDLDNFKEINDEYGHDIGDRALKEVATIFERCFRSSDLISRYGGEEFCLLLEDISRKELEQLLERVRRAFELNTIYLQKFELNYTVSMGVAYGLNPKVEAFLKVSDEALYHAKHSGKNRVVIRDISY